MDSGTAETKEHKTPIHRSFSGAVLCIIEKSPA